MPDIKTRIYFSVVIIYGIYSFFVYTAGTEGDLIKPLSEEAIKGKVLFQEKNCIACHQLYGLGGYMGPDLTNVISAKGKGESYAATFIRNGTAIMPDFHLTKGEVNALIAFLKNVDASGESPPQNFELTWYGTVNHSR